ncbi:hypothetical protein [Streptomyces sp. GS7]|uniref:hypothetical protein n=1 Tax=Streptomyces sp. GS7 TaxID=2692234 RepID=UPI0013194D62|nr:hypothetical protein [Streptomyces sp. GS7]QHC23984.1 hypothetical protein GR130_24035 [Streptomyces sp. GS7]
MTFKALFPRLRRNDRVRYGGDWDDWGWRGGYGYGGWGRWGRWGGGNSFVVIIR